jgi:hypothetical protein
VVETRFGHEKHGKSPARYGPPRLGCRQGNGHRVSVPLGDAVKRLDQSQVCFGV